MAPNPMNMGAKAKKDPKADHWQTPPYILDAIDKFWPQGWFDPCPANPALDGLDGKWPARTYINPPFSQYRAWTDHGRHQPLEQIWMSNHNHDTEWFQALVVDAMCLLFDRVVFIDPTTGKPAADKDGRPQTMIGKCQTLRYKGSDIAGFAKAFQHLGQIVEVRGCLP